MSTTRCCLLVLALLVSQGAMARAADVGFSRHYGDKMVLQRDKPVLIRGFADEGAEVTVTFSGQTKKAIADGDGDWSVTLDPMPANSKGAELAAASAGKKVRLGDVVVGDVFLLAGQTTIDVRLGRDEAGRKAAADLPAVRVLMIETVPAVTPQQDLAEEAVSGWATLDKKTALEMNATAFYVARGLSTASDVPIGIIDLNMGHHFPIAWLSKDALLATTEVFGSRETRVKTSMDMMAKALAEFEDEAQRTKADATRGYPAVHPREDPRYPAAGYNAVLHPMRGLALKGLVLQLGNDYPYVLYEGLVRDGSNTQRASLGQAYKDTYDLRKWCIYLEPVTTPRIPREWRGVFGDEALPIGWITPPGSDLVTMGRHHYEMRELQRQTAEDERGIDLIMPGTQHIPFSAQPADEALLGDRCVTWLNGAVYKKAGVVPTGPVFDHVALNYSQARVFFKPGTAQHLKATPGALDRFEVAGVDLQYAPAKAKIDGQTIRLSSDTVSRIAHVRYNWAIKPDQGLTSANGLPALPFNTDGHAYPNKINTVGEEVLPEEFSTPIPEWKSEGAVIVNGRLNKSIDAGKYLGPTGLRVSPFGPNLYVNSAYLGSSADGKIL